MRHQRDKIRNLFFSRPNQWIPVYLIAEIALQYNTRISELRAAGMNIVNKKERVNGEWHTWFKYIPQEDTVGQRLLPI